MPHGADDPCNLVGDDPVVLAEYDSAVRVFPWRGNTNFVGADIVALDLPISLMGNYHLTVLHPAMSASRVRQEQPGLSRRTRDYDGNPRPSQGRFEIGADETGNAFPGNAVLLSCSRPDRGGKPAR